MARRKTMIAMGSPYFVWINANEIISSWYLRGAVCVTSPAPNIFANLARSGRAAAQGDDAYAALRGRSIDICANHLSISER
jgi:hypothetical protein